MDLDFLLILDWLCVGCVHDVWFGCVVGLMLVLTLIVWLRVNCLWLLVMSFVMLGWALSAGLV